MRPASILSAGSCLFLICCLPFLSFAAPQQEGLPVFRASSELVLLDVVITDSEGGPVDGLKLQDFTVKEDGKEQRISFINPPRKLDSVPPPFLPPNVYSNEPSDRSSGAVPTAIVLDAANSSFKDQVYARSQMLKFLKDQYKPGQRIAIFTVTDRLSLLHDFTDNPDELRTSLDAFNPDEPPYAKIDGHSQPDTKSLRVAVPGEQEKLAQAFRKFQESEGQYISMRRAEVTLAAMSRITRILGGLPGRKNVIWLTGGFPITLVPQVGSSLRAELADFTHRPGSLSATNAENASSLQNEQNADRIRQISAEMATAQVAIYPVDMRGLVVTGMSDTGDTQEVMREVAQQTGGRAFVNRNDVANGVGLVLRDAAATYTVGYYPSNKKKDHEYRSIDLRVNRPKLNLTYRRGYFAVEPFKNNDKKPDRELADAWQDDAPYTLVSFQAKVTPGEKGKARVDFLVDANSLSAEDVAQGKRLDVAFYVSAYSSEGGSLGVRGLKLQRDFTPEVYQKLLKEGIEVHLDADAPAGSRKFHLAVLDNQTGRLGSLSAPVPDRK